MCSTKGQQPWNSVVCLLVLWDLEGMRGSASSRCDARCDQLQRGHLRGVRRAGSDDAS